MALLTAYMEWQDEGETLEQYLDKKVFRNAEAITAYPRTPDIKGFQKYMKDFKKCLTVERAAVSVLPNM